jgi:hypothetical protein
VLELVSAKEMKSFGGQWHVQRNDIGYFEQFAQRFNSFNSQRLIVSLGDIGILENTVKTENLGAPSRGRADPPTTYDPENLAAGTPDPLSHTPIPISCTHVLL